MNLLQLLIRSIEIAPKPIAYIVLDHNHDPRTYLVGDDAYGQKYILASPAVLDEVEHGKVNDIPVVGDPFDVVPLGVAIPLFRREDLPEEWPDHRMDSA